MSARPFVPRLADEELDLLLSRSLDGDLSPEEARVLETLLAHDPAALKRKEELARVVAETAALPAPAPPFALATRVNSTVAEKGSRGGLLARRFGFYPPPGMAIGAMALLAIVAVAIAVLKPSPRADGPVDVFFTDAAKSDAKSAPQQASREAPKAKPKEPARSQAGGVAGARAEAPAAPAAVVASAEESMPKDGGKLDAEKKLAAPGLAANEPALEARQRPLAKAEGDLDAFRAGAPAVASAPAPAPPAAAPQAAGAVAQKARANAAPARAWAVAVKGEGSRRWMLRRAPEGRPASASSLTSSFRITLDADGRVTSVRALDARPVQPALLEFVRGLVFARVETTFGYADERARTQRADAAAAEGASEQPSEIDVEVSTR